MAHRGLARVGLALASLVLALAAGELAVRWLLPPPRAQIAFQPVDPDSTDPAIGTFSLLVATPDGLRLRPNSVATVRRHRVSHRDITLRTNALGLRGGELDESRTRPRILFVGDSITVGDHLAEDETYPAIIGELADASREPWETVNAGISSTAIEDYAALLEAIGPAVEPDAVVVGLFLNDYRRSLEVQAAAPPRLLAWSWLACHLADGLTAARESSAEGLFLAEHREFLDQGRTEIEQRFPDLEPAHANEPGFRDLVIEASHDWGGAWMDDAWVRIEGGLARIKQICDGIGVPTVVMVFPARPQVEAEGLFDYPQRRARSACKRLGIAYIDILPGFRAAATTSDEPLFYDHCHTTPYGNGLIAEEFLRSFSF